MEDAQYWLNEIYSGKWSAIFRNHCADKFSGFTDPDELMEDSRQILAMSLHRKIEKNDGTPLSEAFIMVSFRNAVTDVHRRKFGRGNPRAWLRAFGELGRRLFELYCLARVRRKEVLETVNSEFSALSEFSVKNRAAELLNEMDQREECVGKSQQESSLHDENGDCIQVSGEGSPAEELQSAQAQALKAFLFGDSQLSYKDIGHLVERFENEVGNLSGLHTLDDDQRFIIHATLSGDLTEKHIGDLLDLSVRQVRYKRTKSLEVIKEVIKKAGIVLSDLLDESVVVTSAVGAGQSSL